MTIAATRTGGVRTSASIGPPVREVVAVVLEHHGRIALFRRSLGVRHDRGLWHCITGYLEAGVSPEQQALAELHEEAGVTLDQLSDFEHRASFDLTGRNGDLWLVHTFKAVTGRRRLLINEEHDKYRWTSPAKVRRFSNRVEWLGHVLDAALHPS
jgi:8-oxo-dGTP pyrophosphatase MutT (NUDIX family)